MSRIEGRRPNASVHRMTAGCLPVAGWKYAASQVPSGVLMVTSFPVTAGPAGRAAAGRAAAATPVATVAATKPRRRRSGASAGRVSDSNCALMDVPLQMAARVPRRSSRISRPREAEAAPGTLAVAGHPNAEKATGNRLLRRGHGAARSLH